jgi:hypothetical protein
MSKVRTYLRALTADSLYGRVCVAILGIPFSVQGVYALASWRPTEWYEWLGFLLIAIGIGFCMLLVYMSVFGTDEQFERIARRLRHVNPDGGELAMLLLILVLMTGIAVLAIPITMLVRSLKPGH